MGVNVVENDEAESKEEGAALWRSLMRSRRARTSLILTQPKLLAPANDRQNADRTDDPVRMYLREMGTADPFRAKAKSRSPSASRPAARP